MKSKGRVGTIMVLLLNYSIILMRIKQIKTQSNLYNAHLQISNRYPFEKQEIIEPITPVSSLSIPMSTNFAITLHNSFAFLLLHLKKVTNNQNLLRINIPQTCIFVSGLPHQIFYSDSGQIKSFRGKDGIRMNEVFTFFRKCSAKRSLSKEEPVLACFQNHHYTMLNDTDFLIICRKFRNDPFFAKLEYFKNKVGNSSNQTIQSIYNSQTDYVYSGEAAEGLMGLLSEEELQAKMQEQHYLHYLNGKIALFLNFENNIRLSYAHFYYCKTTSGQYYLVDVKYLSFSNLTSAIKERERKLRAAEDERNKILVMSPEKERKYKSYENSRRSREIEEVMNGQWSEYADKARIKTNQARVMEERRNQEAFKVLFANIGVKLSDIVDSRNFHRARKEILGHDKRKSMQKKWRIHANYNKNTYKRFVTEPADLG